MLLWNYSESIALGNTFRMLSLLRVIDDLKWNAYFRNNTRNSKPKKHSLERLFFVSDSSPLLLSINGHGCVGVFSCAINT